KQQTLALTYKPDSDIMMNLNGNIAAAEQEYRRKKAEMVVHNRPAASTVYGQKVDQSVSQNPAIQTINNQINNLDRQISNMEKRKAEYDNLMREVQIDEDNYKAAKARMDQAVLTQGLNQQKISRISIVEQPTLPYKPSRPWKAAVLAA